MKTKTYEIGENRLLKYNKKKDVIYKKAGKEAIFTPTRWVSFHLYMDEVDAQLNSVSQDRDYVFIYYKMPTAIITVADGTSP